MNEDQMAAEKKVRQDWMGKSGLTLLIWIACAGYVAAAAIYDWDMTLNRQVMIYGVSIAAIFVCPIVLFFEWRTMHRELKAVRESS